MEENQERIENKLDVMISLLYDIKETMSKKSSVKEKVGYFTKKGLSNKEVAKILGISEKHVSKEKALLKKNG